MNRTDKAALFVCVSVLLVVLYAVGYNAGHNDGAEAAVRLYRCER